MQYCVLFKETILRTPWEYFQADFAENTQCMSNKISLNPPNTCSFMRVFTVLVLATKMEKKYQNKNDWRGHEIPMWAGMVTYFFISWGLKPGFHIVVRVAPGLLWYFWNNRDDPLCVCGFHIVVWVAHRAVVWCKTCVWKKRTSKAQILGSKDISEERRAGDLSYSCISAGVHVLLFRFCSVNI